MTDLRKAAEQALGLLGDAERYLRVERIYPIMADDMAECAEILRAALAEPDEVAAAVEAEREACARVCDAESRRRAECVGLRGEWMSDAADFCAAAIRARSKP